MDFGLNITCSEFEAFYKELEMMNKKLKGKASLSTMEYQLFIDAEINKLGQIGWEIKTQYPIGIGATLEFECDSDQTYLKDLLKDLKSIIGSYPVLMR